MSEPSPGGRLTGALVLALALWLPAPPASAQLAADSETTADGSAAIERPVPLNAPAAPWPEGLIPPTETRVAAVLHLDATGRVVGVKLEQGVPEPIAGAARTAAWKWRFSPAIRDGVPIAASVPVLIAVGPWPAPALPTNALPASLPTASHTVVGEPNDRAEVRASYEPSVQPTGGMAEVLISEPRAPRSSSETLRDRRQLRAAPRKSGSDLLRAVPGLFITQHGGVGKAHQIFLRGFDAVHGQDLELWVAGVPVNDVSNIHGQGYADLHFVIPEVVEALRCQAGPYEPTQGDFAVAGTVRYQLGYDRSGVTLKQGLGEWGGRRTLAIARPEGPSNETFAAVESFHSDGFGPSRAADRFSAMAQGVFSPIGGHELRLMASHYGARFDAPGVLLLQDLEAGQVVRSAVLVPGQGGSSDRQQLAIELRSRKQPLDENVTVYVLRRGLALRQNFTGRLLDSVNGDTTQQRNDALTFGITARRTFPIAFSSDRDELAFGLDARSDLIDQAQRHIDQNGAPLDSIVDAAVRAHRIGGYVDIEMHPLRRVVARLGGRADGLTFLVDDAGSANEETAAEGRASRASSGSHLGLKAGLDVAIFPGLHGLVSYGDGFRSPQARSLGNAESAPFTAVHSTEAGLRWAPDRRLRASVAGFASWLSDDLMFDHATGRNGRMPGTFRSGMSGDLVVKTNGLVTSANLTYARAVLRETQGIYQEGYSLPYAPQLVARTESRLEGTLFDIAGAPLRGNVGGGLTLLARRPLPYGEFGHDVFLVDMGVGAEWRIFTFDVEAYNLLDKAWYDGEFVYASSFDEGDAALVPARHVTVGEPRTLWVSLGVRL